MPPGSGYFPGEGDGTLGVMIVADHLGGDDSGDRALIGPAGFVLGQVMKRLGLTRDQVWYETILRCQPTSPIRDKKNRRANWLPEAVDHCSPYLNTSIESKQPKVFLALGDLAFETLTGIALRKPLNMDAVRGYVFPERHGRGWVVASHHPEIMRLGKWEYATTLQWDLTKALRIAKEGFSYEDDLITLMDPDTQTWEAHVTALCVAMTEGRVPALAADIETPYKRGRRESESGDESATDDPTYTIDRISFCGNVKVGVSIPWRMPYIIGIQRILETAVATQTPILFWNRAYDRPRLIHNGIALPISHVLDSMDLYHVCFNHLPRKLGFATSCLPRSYRLRMWKNLASTQPAYYSAMDVITLLRNHLDCTEIAKATGQWGVYETIMVQLDPALDYMTGQGMPVDTTIKAQLSHDFGVRLAKIEADLDSSVPDAIKNQKVWKGRKAAEKGSEKMKAAGEARSESPLKVIAGSKKTCYCSVCGEVGVTASHAKAKTITVPDSVDATQGGLF